MAINISTGISTDTAKIYEFPVGGRAALTARRHETAAAGVHELARTTSYACNSCWYHDAAIAEADKTPRR